MTTNENKNTIVVMTLCNRPDYTRRVLDALAACDDSEQFPVAFSCEPVNREVIMLAKAFRQPSFVNVGKKKVGCNVNTYYALATGFGEYQRVIALEDDTVPGKDFLRFCDWGLNQYEHDKSVFSISGYQRTPQAEVGFRNAVVRERWFTPWGWATWLDRWESVRGMWPGDDNEISWDTVIDKMTRGDRHEVRPMLARIQNIGAVGGVHVPSAAWHTAHHYNPYWIDTAPGVRCDEWHEVPAVTTHALRKDHPC